MGSWFELDWKKEAGRASTETWVDVYDRSWVECGDQDLTQHDRERIASEVFPNATVLDAGCGDGFLLEEIGKKTDNCVGVDISGVALRGAKKRLGENTRLVQAFLEHLPFKDDAFDVVVTAHALEHVRDLKAAAGELKRVAARRLVVMVPIQEYLPYTEDYHLQFFSTEDDLLSLFNIPNATCHKITVPTNHGAFRGDALLLVGDVGI